MIVFQQIYNFMLFIERPKDFAPIFEVVSCFCEHDEDVLFLHRQHHKFHGNLWGVPAGKVDPGEQPIEAIIRELFEETSFVVESKDLTFEQTVYVRFPEFDMVYHMYTTVFSHKPPVTLNPEEHKDYRWMPPHAALDIPLIPEEDQCILLTYPR